jgi:hypothetical protein
VHRSTGRAAVLLLLALSLGAPPAQAGFGPATTARAWCREKTLHYLTRRGYAPYNWQATTYIEGDDYVTKGVWSVDADEIKVECTTRKHGSHRTGKYKIEGVEISGGRKSGPRTDGR